MKEQHDIQLSDFYLVFQPIIHLLSEEDIEQTHFEVLLRSKNSHAFPGDLVDLFTVGEERNKLFLDWYEGQLVKLCESYPEYIFYFNTHPHQLKYRSTWNFLERLQPFSKQIQIEITEKHVNFDGDDALDEDEICQAFRRIKELNFKLNFDDVGTGQNSLEFIAKNLEVISSLKFSIRAFSPLDEQAVMLFLHAWQNIADENNLKFIVEGIETERLAQVLYNNGIVWQQGFYWARTIEL